MTNLPSVSIITPTTLDRPTFNDRIKANGLLQDYKGYKEHLFNIEHLSIGEKLNRMCDMSQGEIIIRMDSDDIYSRDWVTKCVNALIESNCDLIGLSNIYYHQLQTGDIYEYRNQPNSQLYLCGATLCFWRKTWEQNPFPNISQGEETAWQAKIKRAAFGYKDGFLATLHGANTCSHKALPMMKKVAYSHPLMLVQ